MAHVHWAIEDPGLHGETLRLVAPISDFIFTTVAECLPSYESYGHPSDVMLFACNPRIHRRVPADPAVSHDIVLVATNYAGRIDHVRSLLLPLVEGGYDIMVWGQGWIDPARSVRIPEQRYGGTLPYEDLATVYSSAKIVLGLHLVADSRTQTSMRTYEALGCGACYLTHDTLAHRSLFEPGTHLLTSRDANTTCRLARAYLSDPEGRARIAKAGQALVYAKHTYALRAHDLERVVAGLR